MRSAALRGARRFCSGTVRMPVGATPQIMISANGTHKHGAVSKITSAIVDHGASIAATKKIVMHDQFSLMMSVWVPPSASPATVLAALQQSSATDQFGCTVTAVALPDPSPAAPPEVRRMLLECPQKPGIVLAVTELLKDQGCAITNMDAQTYLKEDVIWFRLECIIEVTTGTEPSLVEEQLRWWTASQQMDVNLIFDSSRTDRFQPLEQA